MSREARVGTVLAAVALALGVAGYAVGHAGTPSAREVAKTRAEALRSAEKTAERRAYGANRRRGVEDGQRGSRAAGALKGRRDGKQKTQQALSAQGSQTGGYSAPQTGGQTGSGGYSTAPLDDSTRTPSTTSPQGKQLLKQSPDCKNVPPPPSNYKGPVQC